MRRSWLRFCPTAATALLSAFSLGGCGGTGLGASGLLGGTSTIQVAQQSNPTSEIRFVLSAGSAPLGIVYRAASKNYWFTDPGISAIGVISNTGSVREYALPSGSLPQMLAVDTGGNLWYTDAARRLVAKMSASGKVLSQFPTAGSPYAIVSGGGVIWFTDTSANAIGYVSPAGAVAEYPIPTGVSDPSSIALGPDGRIWFAESAANKIGAFSPAAVSFSEYSIPSKSSPRQIASQGGYLWFSEGSSKQLGRISTAGKVTEYADSGNPSAQFGAIAATNSAIWANAVCAGCGLQSFSLSSHAFGPVVLSNADIGQMIQGSDGNVWLTDKSGAIGVYVLKALTATASSISFTALAQTQAFNVSETGYKGVFYAANSNSAVISLSAATGTAFTVTALAPGSATVTVSDNKGYPKVGNGTVISVTVTTTSIIIN